MATERFEARREADLAAIAARFAATLGPGSVVALRGPLGAGKTAFARAIVKTLHGDQETASPTFTFWHRYEGEPPINHLDLYRIDDPAEAHAIGLAEALDADSIALVEWPERAPGLLPAGTIAVSIDGAGDGAREITIERP